MAKTRIWLSVIGLICFSFGCATHARFVYTPGTELTPPVSTFPLKVAVTPFKDLRGEKNLNTSLIYLLPLVPYGPINYDRPDAANGFLFHASYNFRPSEDLANAVIDECKKNGLFEEIFFTYRENEPGVDLILSGTIKEARYDGKLISYGLSAYGPLLWFLGLPAGTTSNGLSLTLELKRASDNQIIWQHTIEGKWGKTVGLYYNWAADFDGFPLILKNGLQASLESLADELQTKKVSYWEGE